LGRIQHYLPAEEIILKEKKIKSEKDSSRIIANDSARLLARVKQEDNLVLLDPDGKLMSSLEIAGWLKNRMNSGVKSIVFGLGGPLGLDQTVRKRADLRLSLSPMTFTHEMARLIILEQIYRALRLNAGHPYHR
ncbi:MAG: 23S rRNA (pseudouridine(1915)-N(3))-methyltransferase RlmH, partial [Deltaproteobacteria bacterium]|nr:23S rRNA (pseudouridine(1915)-N(3))-methyltransferase RlmH [Deltaproteobacteria bacterium]